MRFAFLLTLLLFVGCESQDGTAPPVAQMTHAETPDAQTVAMARGNDEPRQSSNATVTQTIGTTLVTVSYGRPSVRNRTIYGDLVPYGQVWRTGANEATTVTFSDNVQVEGQPLDAGTYGLFTVPTENGWTVIFNEVAEQWGAGEYDESKDILRVDVTPEAASSPMETMTFTFDNVTENQGTLMLRWDDVRVPITIMAGA